MDSSQETLNSSNRLHQSSIPIIAITGGIGSGKSTLLREIESLGHPTLDADRLIKEIYEQDQEIKIFLSKNAPDCIQGKKINFMKLRDSFFQNNDLKKALEQKLYQKLPIYFQKAIKGLSYIFYEIPLLFEKDLVTKVDMVIVAYAPLAIQKERVIKRDNSSEQTLNAILANQISIEEKKDRADFVIDTRISNLTDTANQTVSEVLTRLSEI